MSTINYLLECFQDKIKKDKNPIIKEQIRIKKGNINSLFYYEIYKNTIIVHSKKKYKSQNKSLPEAILPEEGSTEEDYNKIKNNITKPPTTKNEKILTSFPKSDEIKNENLINIKGISNEKNKPPPKNVLIEEIGEEKEKNIQPSYQLLDKLTS